MSDESKIEPALTADDSAWEDNPFDGDPPEDIARMIALANAALPDDDPRKITERWVSAMRDAVETMMRDGHGKSLALAKAADALASYLPPETPTPLTVERGGLSALPPDLERDLRNKL